MAPEKTGITVNQYHVHDATTRNVMEPKTWIIRNEQVLENCVGRLKELPFDTPWIVNAKPYKRNRTQEQNDLMWVLLTLIGQHTGHSKEEMYDIATEMFLTPRTTTHRGRVYHRYSTSRLKVAEMSDFIERLYQLGAEEGLYMPPRGEAV